MKTIFESKAQVRRVITHVSKAGYLKSDSPSLEAVKVGMGTIFHRLAERLKALRCKHPSTTLNGWLVARRTRKADQRFESSTGENILKTITGRWTYNRSTGLPAWVKRLGQELHIAGVSPASPTIL